MAHDRVYSDDAELLGGVLIGLAEAIKVTHNDLSSILEKYGFDEIHPDEWYSVSALVDFFNELESLPSGMLDLAAVGKHIASSLEVPATISTLDEYLRHSIPLHQQVHRGNDVGSVTYSYDRQHNLYEVRADVPYPVNYMYGLYFGFAQRFLDHGFIIEVSVDHKHVKTFVIRED